MYDYIAITEENEILLGFANRRGFRKKNSSLIEYGFKFQFCLQMKKNRTNDY